MKALKENMNGIVMCLFEILVGILLLISPVGFTTSIIIVAGIAMLVIGVADVIRYFRTEPVEAAKSQLLLSGLIMLFLGGFCMTQSHWFIVTFPVLTMVYGVVILLTAFAKVQWTVDMLRMKKGKWFLPAISALVSIACAVVILQNPFTSTAVLWMFTGASLIVEAIFDAVALIMGNKSVKG